jgi:site-specific recombinase XerD
MYHFLIEITRSNFFYDRLITMMIELINICIAFLPNGADRKSKDLMNRLNRFLQWWVAQEDIIAWMFNLATYRDDLAEAGFAPASIKAHLATIRGYFRSLLQNPAFKAALLELIGPKLTEEERKQSLDALIGQILQAIDPRAAPVEHKEAARRNQNINEEPFNELFSRLRPQTLAELRDVALITLMVGTGIRENEVCALNISDIPQTYQGELALHVPTGRGCTERHIPYLDAEWVLEVIDIWLKAATISSGPVFRGFYKSGKAIRDTRLSVSAVEQILSQYPITVRGEPMILKPLNLRQAYAGHLHRRHLDPLVIQEYLGVKGLTTVWSYIGTSIYQDYVPYEFDLSILDGWREA